MMVARPNCRRLLRQEDCLALSLAFARAGRSRAARMAMMAMTTSNSINVNPVLGDSVPVQSTFFPGLDGALPGVFQNDAMHDVRRVATRRSKCGIDLMVS